MVLYNVRGQLPLRLPEQLSINVKTEAHTGSPGFHVGAQQPWQQTHGSIGQDQPTAGLTRIPSPLRAEQGQQAAGLSPMPPPHRMEKGQQVPCLKRMSFPQMRSPSSGGHSSPKLEHQLYGDRDREASYEEYSQDRKRCKVQESFHTISSQSQSQLLSPRGPAGSGPASTRDTTVGSKYGEPSHPGNRSLSRMATAPPLSRSGPPMNPLDEPSPLGLTLRKTPSLIDLISMKLQQGGNGDQGGLSSPESIATQEAAKNRPGKCLVPSVTAQDKLKASNFPATSLKIGTWERTSRYEGDLVGKCYYAKRKLVWEVLESGLKSKIEIQWSDISAMKASCPDNLPGTLEIEVSRPPQFFRETNPQPRKHTLWQTASDFTGGQATICKRHSLQFPEGVLNRHYEKLVQCDPRLKALVDGLSTRLTPDFDHSSWMFDEQHQLMPGHHNIGHSTSLDGSGGDAPFIGPHHLLSLPGGGLVNHGGIQSDPKAEVRSLKMQSSDLSSPSSVIDSRAGDDSGTSDTEDLRLHDDLDEYDHFGYTHPTIVGAHDGHDVKPPCNNLFMMGGEAALSPDQKLAEIRQHLLEEGAWSNEQQVMNPTRLRQLSTSFGEELPNPFARVLEGSDHSHHYSLSAMVKHEVGPEEQDWTGSTMAMNGRLAAREPSFNSLMSCFNRNASSELLLHLPRVASLPQLFETPSHAPGGRYDLPYSKPSYLGSEKLR